MRYTFVPNKNESVMSLLNFLGLGNNQAAGSISEYKEKGAIILDVRTPGEYSGGHIRNSINIPLNELGNRISEIEKKNKPVITCCQSGMRSAQATSILQKNNIDVINGGGWQNLDMNLK